LSSEVLDLAMICPDAAKKFIEGDSRFEVLGACVKNSDVFILNKHDIPKKIGVTRNKNYQKQMVIDTFDKTCEIIPMAASALPYALERGDVEGIITDLVKGIEISNGRIIRKANNEYITYVFVVRKEFKKRREFKEFIKKYNEAVNDFKDKGQLLTKLDEYINLNKKGGKVQWQKWKQILKFVTIKE